MFSTLSKKDIFISATYYFVVCKCFEFGQARDFVVWQRGSKHFQPKAWKHFKGIELAE